MSNHLCTNGYPQVIHLQARRVSTRTEIKWIWGSDTQLKTADEGSPTSSEDSVATPPSLNSSPVLKDSNKTLLQTAPSYVTAIMTPEDHSYPRLDCTMPEGDRYDYLRSNATNMLGSDVRIKYFFALDLHQCVHILPRLLGSIVESMRFLGPKNCALSVVEGRSEDGTYEVLKLLREEIEAIGAQYLLTTNEVDPTAEGVGRIEALAELRNQALRPLVDHPEDYSVNSTVIFINDVAICMEDILELIHQRFYQNADMACAMDWTYVGHDPTLYDVWIARGMNGDAFFDIPADGNWNSAWNLFWNNPNAQQSLRAGRPFQVFSCWNGATSFTAKPLLEQKIKFRSAYEDECAQGEPKIFCKEMWNLGHGKIAVVPSINLEYSDKAAKKIKSAKGYVFERLVGEAGSAQIQWELTPPPLIRCIRSYKDQTWVPWNEGLVELDDTSP
jgi:alpha-1,3-mannosyltransferase